MSTKPKYYIVEASALPEVFLKVAEAKRLLAADFCIRFRIVFDRKGGKNNG